MLLVCASACHDVDLPERPNLILIVTDDQRWDRLDEMPALQDRLANRGVQFTNAFVTSPLCNPSRASILTGRYASRTGLFLPNGKVGAAETFHATGASESTIAAWLEARGYATGLFGKYMNAYWRVSPEIPRGWTRWHAFRDGQELYYDYVLNENGTHVPYASDPEDYSTDVLADRALAFIRDNADRPFFVYFAPFAPHWTAEPAPRHEAQLADWLPVRPPSFLEDDLSDKPAIVRFLRLLWPEPLMERVADLDRESAARQESLLAVDDAIARIDDVLEELEIARDTVIVFTSDNGVAEGEHWVDGKNLPYEEMLRVPFIVRPGRGVWPPIATERVALNIDLAPTLAGLAGAEPSSDVDGIDLFADPPGRNRSFAIEAGRLFLLPRWSGIRSPRYKYAEYNTGEQELYDLRRDPGELDNLVVTDPGPRVDRVVDRLASQLERFRSGETLARDRRLDRRKRVEPPRAGRLRLGSFARREEPGAVSRPGRWSASSE